MFNKGPPAIIVLLLVLFITALQSCKESDRASEMKRVSVSYLEENIPPCLPDEETRIDPCPTGIPPSVKALSMNIAPHYWPHSDYQWDFTELLLGVMLNAPDRYAPILAPHIVIRGIAQNDTTRCGLYPVKPYDFQTDATHFYGLYHYYCFIDITVKEYIIGTGPSELIVIFHQEVEWYFDEEEMSHYTEDRLAEIYADVRSQIVSAYEGRELIMMLRPSFTVYLEAWGLGGGFGLWAVQQGENDEIRAVSYDYSQARTDAHRNLLNIPLDEFIRLIKQAHQNKIARTGGRIGEDPTLPMLVTDANYLQDYYIAGGAVYEGDEATRLPPPVPGEEEPAQDPTRTGEEQPGANTIPAPGEEETTPPPTDDATTTTTQPPAEETSTTTSTTPPSAPGSSTTSSSTPEPGTEEPS